MPAAPAGWARSLPEASPPAGAGLGAEAGEAVATLQLLGVAAAGLPLLDTSRETGSADSVGQGTGPPGTSVSAAAPHSWSPLPNACPGIGGSSSRARPRRRE